MDFDTKGIITVKWMGYRKDANKGSVWGWFVFNGKPDSPLPSYVPFNEEPVTPDCYILSGKIGKSLVIERRILNYEFLEEAKFKLKNFKQLDDPSKIMAKWGKPLDEELSMFLLAEKLRR